MCWCDWRAAHLSFFGLQLEVTTICSPFSMVLPARLRALAFRLDNVDGAYWTRGPFPSCTRVIQWWYWLAGLESCLTISWLCFAQKLHIVQLWWCYCHRCWCWNRWCFMTLYEASELGFQWDSTFLVLLVVETLYKSTAWSAPNSAVFLRFGRVGISSSC